MTNTQKNISHIADLAKLEVDEKSAEIFSEKMDDVLGYMDILQEVNTDDVAPTNQVTGLRNVFREDVVVDYPEEQKKKMFREAPEVLEGYIVVPHSISKLT